LTKINDLIFAYDVPFSAKDFENFDNDFEESCVYLRKNNLNGKDIKEYTVVEYFTLVKILEKQNAKKHE
jgi:hypothetical protein